jgi:hypothetical protein
MKQNDRFLVTVAIVAHLIVTLLHGRAHTELAVGLNAWQQIYVLVVIVCAPLVAGVLLWLPYARLGVLLLVIAMAGSLIFGVYFHYVTISPDHVSHLPPGDSQSLFKMTAMLLAVTETFGVVAGLLALRRLEIRTGAKRLP